MKLFKLFYLFIIIAFLSSELAYSQCGCLGGAAVGGLTPIGGTANVGLLREDYFRASLFYSYAYGDKFFSGDEPATKDIEQQYRNVSHYSTHFSSLLVGYGITENLTLEVELGYFPQKLQDYGTKDETGSGLSHASFYGKYNLYNSIVNELEFTIGAGLKLPLDIQKENIPQHVKASTGAYGVSFQAFLHKGFKANDIHLFLINRTDYNFENKNEYQYGSTINTSFYITKGILKSLTGILEIRNEIRMKDKFKSEYQEDAGMFTGGYFFHFAPQLNYTIGQFNFSVLFDYPIFQYYYGHQLGNNYSIGLNVSWLTKF